MQNLEKQKLVRMCVACRTKNLKSNLIRVVRTVEKTILIDFSGKIEGRGAYICCSEKCLKILKKKKCIQRSLKEPVEDSIYSELEERIKSG